MKLLFKSGAQIEAKDHQGHTANLLGEIYGNLKIWFANRSTVAPEIKTNYL